MAQKKYGNRPAADPAPPTPGDPQQGSASEDPASGFFPIATTGRQIVVFQQGESEAGLKKLANLAGLSDVASTSMYSRGVFELAEVKNTQVLHLDNLDAAIIQGGGEEIERVSSIAGVRTAEIKHTFAERYLTLTGRKSSRPASKTISVSSEYLDGIMDALSLIRSGRPVGDLPGLSGEPMSMEAAATGFQDEPQATWGLQAMRVLQSKFTGKGVRVAVLDTGFDLGHPDFKGRRVEVQSFAGGNGQDFDGHGTHCIGTACGSRGLHGRRYGIASDAEIFVGQVFRSGPGGTTAVDGDIWQGMSWAITNKCQIVSMSFERSGNPVQPGESFNQDYESLGARALAAGTLMIAAAGNGSSRPSMIRPVNQPANSPSIVAVGALDSSLKVAAFSNRAINLDGGRVDFAGPGVAIISSWPMPIRYKIESGTSMATPHVAGVAALLSEAHGGVGGLELWKLLAYSVQNLGLDPGDVGFGMPIAP